MSHLAAITHCKEPLRDGGSAGPARADPADGRRRGSAGKETFTGRSLAQGLGWLLKKQ